MTDHAERCTCRECRELDLLPTWRQGIPDTFQFALFSEQKKKRAGAAKAKRKPARRWKPTSR